MNRDAVIGVLVVGLLFGGFLLLMRRPAAVEAPVSEPSGDEVSMPTQVSGRGNMSFVAAQAEGPRRYQNKEIREVEFEYNDDGSFRKLKMVINRDYAIT